LNYDKIDVERIVDLEDFSKKEIEFAKSKCVSFEGKNIVYPQCRYMRARGTHCF